MVLCRLGCWNPSRKACSAWRGKSGCRCKRRFFRLRFWRGAAGGPGHSADRRSGDGPDGSDAPGSGGCGPVSSRHSIRRGEGPRRVAESLQHAVAGAGQLAAAAQHRHALAVEGVAADLAFDHAFGRARARPRPRRDRRARWCGWRIAWPGWSWRARSWRRPAGRDVSLSRRWTMPGRASPPMPIKLVAAMGDQGIDQRAVGIARRRMHHQPGRLVDHDEVLVLVDHVQRDILAPRPRRHRRRARRRA